MRVVGDQQGSRRGVQKELKEKKEELKTSNAKNQKLEKEMEKLKKDMETVSEDDEDDGTVDSGKVSALAALDQSKPIGSQIHRLSRPLLKEIFNRVFDMSKTPDTATLSTVPTTATVAALDDGSSDP